MARLGARPGSPATAPDVGLSVADYGPPLPWYLPHRGEAGVRPENSLSGLLRAAQRRPFVDLDAHVLPDGTAVVMHDATIDRTSSGTGNVSAFSRATWIAQVLDASAWMGGVGYANENLPLLVDVLRAGQAEGRDPLWSIEAKNAGAGAAIVSALQAAGVSRSRAVVSYAGTTELAPAVAAGYRAMRVTAALSVIEPWSTLVGLGIHYVCFTTIEAGSAASIAAAKAAGIRGVFAYTVDRRTDRDAYLALGADGVFSNHSEYIGANVPLATRDTWADGRWMPGQIMDGSVRGSVMAGGRWGFTDGVSQSWQGGLLGWACPLVAPTYTVKFRVKVDAWANIGRWWALFLCASSDAEYLNGVTSSLSGYTLLVRQSGSMEIYKKNSGGAGTTLSASFAGAAYTAGVDEAFTLVVSPGAVTLTRDSNGNTLAYSDADYRGGYLHFGRNGCSASLAGVSIT